MIKIFSKYIKYLIGKTSELGDLETKDALLAKTVLDIHRKRTHSEFVIVPLFNLKQIHAIDRDNAIKATEKRVRKLEEVRNILLQKKNITRDVLGEYLPSVSWIKVVKEPGDSYISYEGNGRLAALQQVFSPSDGMSVEVEEYYFKNPKKILRRMSRVRRLNGF